MKKLLTIVGTILIILAACWLAVFVSKLNKLEPEFRDALDTMDDKTKTLLEEQMNEIKDKVVEKNDAKPEGAKVIARGDFKSRAYEVSGRALIMAVGNKKILRFEDFKTINGPSLRVYLSANFGLIDYIDLGLITATEGNINYDISPEVDGTRYNKILIWSEPFSAMFSYAELK